ncbi:hypothetical protein ACPWSR_17940 [Alloiococcus sp. CFN-8]|uniref:hypothetical protein n=1 Tax=Alloiococcus sp. CFN-8 TaxID=3416081 RepID=UPI003CF84E0D
MYKSKFKTLVLSLIPGFGHYYIGANSRGALFTFSAIAYMFLAVMMDGYNYLSYYYGSGNSYSKFIFVALAALWLFSIIDVMSLRKKLVNNNYDELIHTLEKENEKLIAVFLSIIPGAGHFYLKRKKEGVRLLSLFIFIFFIYSFAPLQVLSLMMILVIIYTLINLKEIFSVSINGDEEDFVLSDLLNSSYMRYLGIGFIALGILILFNKIALSFIDRGLLMEVFEYLREGIVSVVLIVLGVRLIFINKFKKGDGNEAVEGRDN